jgi:hypothetical protein
MPLHLLSNLTFVSLLISPTPLRCLAAGGVGGWALLIHNPFPHAVFAVPWLIWLALRPRRWHCLVLLLAAYFVVFFPIDRYWLRVKQAVRSDQDATAVEFWPSADGVARTPPTGRAAEIVRSTSPAALKQLFGGLNRFTSVFALPSPSDAFWHRLAALARSLAWDTPGLLVLCLATASSASRSTAARLLGISAGLAFVAYEFVPMSGGHGWGYRYFFPYWAALPIIGGGAVNVAGTASSRRLFYTVILAALGSLVFCVPARLYQIHWFISDHRGQAPRIEEFPDRPPATLTLIFVDIRNGWFKDDLIRNDPFLREPTIRLVGQGIEQDARNANAIASARGLRAVLLSSDPRGTVWALHSFPTETW